MMKQANEAKDSLQEYFKDFDEECPIQQLSALVVSKVLTIFGVILITKSDTEGVDEGFGKVSKLSALESMISALQHMVGQCKEAREQIIEDNKNAEQ